MKTIKKLAILTMLLFSFASCEEVESIELGTIMGTVTDGTILEPLQGVSVTLSPTGKTITTGSDGKFEFREIEAGQYTISVSKEITIVIPKELMFSREFQQPILLFKQAMEL